MKKLILTLTILGTISCFAFAQDAGFGLKGGINLSTYKVKIGGFSIAPDRAVKVRVGIFYRKPINDQWSVQFEGLFNGTGFKPQSGSGVDKVNLNYLAFPVMFKFHVSEKFNLHAGPELAFLLSAKIDDMDVGGETKDIDLGLGLGGELSLGDNTALGLRYTFGLINTDDSGASGVSQKSDNIEIALLFKF